MKRLFSTGEVASLTGLKITTLKKWCTDGIVTPKVAANGTGSRRLFSTMQVLGLVYARLWSQLGAQGEFLKSVVDFFQSMEETKLKKELESGKKFLMVDPSGRAKLVETLGEEYRLTHWLINVKNQYSKLGEDITALHQR